MEKLLLKLAQQLDSMDEASLMELWSKYATITERFEPTRRWEEAALVFSLIQAKHWKNQLFNYMFAKTSRPQANNEAAPNLNFGFSLEPKETQKPQEPQAPISHCRILSFTKTPPKNNS
ncbi:MAG: hypothetical protein IJU40_07085 [Desulfovibrionaceae bacterium]|nr:hypothetical protein [Desulfovibrionaceae bacterium]